MKSENSPLNAEKLLTRIMQVEGELGSIRQELVRSLGGPSKALPKKNDELEDDTLGFPGYVALEILSGTGTVNDNPNVNPSPTKVKVENLTGEAVTLSQGPVMPGVVSITIPDGQSRGINRSPSTPLITEFVQYEWYEPLCTPGTICIGQYHRYVIEKTSDQGDGQSADNTADGRIVLRKKSTGGFELTT